MAIAQRMAISGLSAGQIAAILGTVANTLTATGTTQATALALAADINRFTTVAASSGCIIPALNPGDEMVVFNGGANALSLYPPVGGAINAVATNGAYSVATATPLVRIICITPTQYQVSQSA